MRLLSYCACLLAVGCGPDTLGPQLKLVVAGTVDNNQTCSGSMTGGLSSLSGIQSVRVTIRVRDSGGKTLALCDTQPPASDVSMIPPPDFGFPTAGTDANSTIDFFAEAWDNQPTPNRLASGALLGQPIGSASLPILRLFGTESFRCFGPPPMVDRTQYRLKLARAFHTATPLPDGEVLIAGGLTAAINGTDGPANNDEYFIVGTIEVYQPSTGTFVSLSGDNMSARPRAFHHAALLPDDGSHTFRVLLVGGITTTAPQQTALHDYTGEGFPYTFRLTPVNGGATLQHQDAVEIITYDPNGKTIKSTVVTPAAGFHPTAYQAAAALSGKSGNAEGIATAGGATVAAGVLTLDQHLDVSPDGKTVRAAMLTDNRLGGTLVALDDTHGMIVGGIADATVMPAQSQFEQVTFGGGAPVASPYFAAMSPFPNLQFATATALPPPGGNMLPSVLVSGGLETLQHAATNPPSDNGGLYLVTQQTMNVACGAMGMMMCPAYVVKPVAAGMPFAYDPATCNLPNRWKPVAWNAATLLPSGDRVLVTGGTPRNVNNQPTCHDCDGTDNSLSCAVKQSGVYSIVKNDIESIHPNGPPTTPPSMTENLQIARFGHTQTILPDGTVAIIGGFTRKTNMANKTETWGVAEVEIWNPSRRQVVVDNKQADLDDPVRADLLAIGMSRKPGMTFAQSNPTAGATTPTFVTCQKPQ